MMNALNRMMNGVWDRFGDLGVVVVLLTMWFGLGAGVWLLLWAGVFLYVLLAATLGFMAVGVYMMVVGYREGGK